MYGFKSVLAASFAALVSAHPHHGDLEKRQSGVPFGATIFSCTVPGTVAVTFDDGPYIYTSGLLDLLASTNHKVTFFQNGQNWDSIYNYGAELTRAIASGHQLGHHSQVTWDYHDLC
jgi:peptidoglycan/xylan/chitin deacetylase (PgdA/CDA1 family)